MRKTLMIIAVVLVLCLCGCSNAPQSSETSTEPSQSESLPIKDSEKISQETDAPRSSVDIDSLKESGIASETTVSDVKETEKTPKPKEEKTQNPPKEETRATGDSVTTSSFEPVKPSSKPTETKAPETAPVTEKPKVTEAPKETAPSAPPVETEPEPSFDINYWISYAQGVAVSKGLTLESSAVDCWDNPITANPDCIYLERDINSRLNRYAGDEDITDVWIWYECIGANKYLIYIGYA
ncbi:MAG: hypothetical protein ACI3U0_02415 [Oscillospiraceae bacterium]